MFRIQYVVPSPLCSLEGGKPGTHGQRVYFAAAVIAVGEQLRPGPGGIEGDAAPQTSLGADCHAVIVRIAAVGSVGDVAILPVWPPRRGERGRAGRRNVQIRIPVELSALGSDILNAQQGLSNLPLDPEAPLLDIGVPDFRVDGANGGRAGRCPCYSYRKRRRKLPYGLATHQRIRERLRAAPRPVDRQVPGAERVIVNPVSRAHHRISCRPPGNAHARAEVIPVDVAELRRIIRRGGCNCGDRFRKRGDDRV